MSSSYVYVGKYLKCSMPTVVRELDHKYCNTCEKKYYKQEEQYCSSCGLTLSCQDTKYLAPVGHAFDDESLIGGSFFEYQINDAETVIMPNRDEVGGGQHVDPILAQPEYSYPPSDVDVNLGEWGRMTQFLINNHVRFEIKIGIVVYYL